MPQEPGFVNPWTELAYIHKYNIQQRARRVAAEQMGPHAARLMSRYARTYPWMKPGVARSLAMAGKDPEDPDAQAIARSSFLEYRDDNRNYYSQQVKAGALTPGEANRALNFPYEYKQYQVTDPTLQLSPQEFDRRVDQYMIDLRANNPDAAPAWFETNRNLYIRRLRDQTEGKLVKTPEYEDELRQRRETRRAAEGGRESGGGGRPGSLAALQMSKGMGDVARAGVGDIQANTRALAMAADAPIQEIQGQFRNLYALTHGQSFGDIDWLESQSDLGVMLGNPDLDQGSGYFLSLDSEVAQERRERESKRGQIGGHNVTLGRWLADTVTTPNTMPFDVLSGTTDLAVQIFADPTAYGAGKAGELRAARDLFEADNIEDAAGLVRGLRPRVQGQRVGPFLDSPAGTRAIESLTESQSAYEVARKLNHGKSSDFVHEPWIYSVLADTRTPDETRYILEDVIKEGQVRRVSDLTGSYAHGLARVAQPKRTPRLFDKMPAAYTNISDQRHTANQIVLALRNAKAPESVIAEHFDRIAAAANIDEVRDGVYEAIGGVRGMLVHSGIDEELAAKVTARHREESLNGFRRLVRQIGDDAPTPSKITIDGVETDLDDVHDLMEATENLIHLPNARAVRRMVSKFPHLIGPGGKLPEGAIRDLIELPPAAVDFMMQEIWKPFVLMRGAWLVRVLAEEQLRLGASGYDSLFSGHPIAGMAWILGRKGTTTAGGDPWTEVEELSRSLSRTGWNYRPGAVRTRIPTIYSQLIPEEAGDFRSWVSKEFAEFNRNPLYNKIANANSRDEVLEWLARDDDGKALLATLIERNPRYFRNAKAVRHYVDDLFERFEYITQGDTRLINAIRDGELDGVSMYRTRRLTGHAGDVATPEINPLFTRHLSGYQDVLPERVAGYRTIASGETAGDKGRKFVDTYIYGAMSHSTNRLSRAPLFKQSYWREVTDLLQFSDVETRALVLANARRAKLPRRTIRNLERVSLIKEPGELTLDELEVLAKSRAMDRTKDLLYDLSEKRQIFDVMRNLTPFGDAWHEVITRWLDIAAGSSFLAPIEGLGPIGKLPALATSKPARRFQQIVEGARRSGFFYKNEYGDEVYNMPGVAWLTKESLGVPIQLQSRARGLNMWGEVIPGIGPTAQIPLNYFLDRGILPAKQEQLVRDWFLKFGAPENAEITNLKAFAPGWFKTLMANIGLKTPDEVNSYAATVNDTAAYLWSTGDYGTSPHEISRLMNDARDKAGKFHWIRMAAQFISPSAPHPEFLVYDKDGELLALDALAREYRQMETEDFETALPRFIDKYGFEALGATIPSSITATPGLPATRESASWVQDHPRIKDEYGQTYFLFGPQGGKFDIEVYTEQFQSGNRQKLTNDQYKNLTNDMFHRYWRQWALTEMGVAGYSQMSPDQREWWSQFNDDLDEQYPTTRAGMPERGTIEEKINELYRAADDKDLRNTDGGEGLRQYLELRDQALAAADEAEISLTTNRRAADVRQWLRDSADRIIGQHPGFKPIWDFVLSREFRD